jgi:ABC-type transporter Mla maintaining outer membrane lipid asymmetry ATPase subunit MlaF
VSAVLEIDGVSHDYRALRPLRIQRLTIAPGESVAVLGLDRAAAEVLVHLVTGAALPDGGGIRIFGRETTAIADADDWLATVDRFGIVSERAVLLEQLSVIQNLAMPFSLEIEPPSADVRARAAALAVEVGFASASAARSRSNPRCCCWSMRAPGCPRSRPPTPAAASVPWLPGAEPPCWRQRPTSALRRPSPIAS